MTHNLLARTSLSREKMQLGLKYLRDFSLAVTTLGECTGDMPCGEDLCDRCSQSKLNKFSEFLIKENLTSEYWVFVSLRKNCVTGINWTFPDSFWFYSYRSFFDSAIISTKENANCADFFAATSIRMCIEPKDDEDLCVSFDFNLIVPLKYYKNITERFKGMLVDFKAHGGDFERFDDLQVVFPPTENDVFTGVQKIFGPAVYCTTELDVDDPYIALNLAAAATMIDVEMPRRFTFYGLKRVAAYRIRNFQNC